MLALLVPLAVRVEGERIDRAEVATDRRNLLFVDLVEEAHLELRRVQTSRRHRLSRLTTTEDDLIMNTSE